MYTLQTWAACGVTIQTKATEQNFLMAMPIFQHFYKVEFSTFFLIFKGFTKNLKINPYHIANPVQLLQATEVLSLCLHVRLILLSNIQQRLQSSFNIIIIKWFWFWWWGDY